MRRYFGKTSTLFAVMLMVFALGCSDDDNTSPTGLDDMGIGSAIRVVHNSPDAPSVDLYVKGSNQPVATDLSFGSVTPYLDIAEGTYAFQLRASGASPTSAPAFETPEIAVPDGVTITAMAAGLFNSSNDTDKFRVLTFVEDFAAPAAGKIAVRIVHASADAPTVGVDVGDDGSSELTLDRFAATDASGVQLDANTELQIGIRAGATRVTGFTIPALPSGTELFVVASGLLGNLPREADGFQLWAIGEQASATPILQNPTVFALHASPDAPAVDIYVGGTNVKLVENLGFGELSAAIQVPPASYPLDFKASGSSATAVSAATPMLEAGERYLAIASGFLTPEGNAPGFELIAVPDAFSLDVSGANISIVHASPDAPNVDVGPSNGGVITAVPDFTNLGFKATSPQTGTALTPGGITVGVAVTGTDAAVAEFDLTLAGGMRAYANAVGALGGDGEPFRLVIVDTSVFPWAASQVAPK